MGEELVPFGVGDVTVFGAGALLAAASDKRPVVFDDVVVVDRDVALGGVQTVVAEDFRGDMNGETGGDGFVAKIRRKSCGVKCAGVPSVWVSPLA